MINQLFNPILFKYLVQHTYGEYNSIFIFLGHPFQTQQHNKYIKSDLSTSHFQTLTNHRNPCNNTTVINPNPNPFAIKIQNNRRSFCHNYSINQRILPLDRGLGLCSLLPDELWPLALTCIDKKYLY